MRSVILFILFCFAGMQVPQITENYHIGASAVVAELQSDYDKLVSMASEYNLSVEEFLEEARKTDNIYAKRIVQFAEGKIPRYLELKSQLEVFKKGEVFNIVYIVFTEHDSIIWNNVVDTFKPGLYLNLDAAWYIFIGTISAALVIIIKIIFFLLTPHRRRTA